MKHLRFYLLGGILLLALTSWLGLTGYRHWRAEPEAKPNYTFIEEGLSMGGSVAEPPRGTRAVLNLCEIEDPYQAEFHAWPHIPDAAPAPSLQWLRERVAFVESHRQAGHSTYIHCAAGISRSGMVIVAYLMRKNQWTRDQALAYVREQRPQVQPNTAFMELLLEYEKELKNGPS